MINRVSLFSCFAFAAARSVCFGATEGQKVNPEIIQAANLFNYTVESLAHITTDDRVEVCVDQIDLILNEYKVATCPDEILRANYGKLLDKLGKIKARNELREFESKIAAKRLEVDLLKIDGDMIGVFAFHQDPLGLSVGTDGVKWNPGAVLGQIGSLNYMNNAKNAQRRGAEIEGEIATLTKDFVKMQETWTDLHEVKIDFFKSQNDYAKSYPGVASYLLDNQQVENLLASQKLPDEARFSRLNDLKRDFSFYPPFHVLHGATAASLYLKTKNESFKQMALDDFSQYEKSPVTVYKRDPYRLTLLQVKSLLVSPEESIPLLKEIDSDYLRYSKDVRLSRFLIDHYLRAHRLESAKSVLNLMQRFETGGSPLVRASIEVAKLQIEAENAYQAASNETKNAFNRAYSSFGCKCGDIVSLRKLSGNDASFLNLVAPLVYQHFSFGDTVISGGQSAVMWKENRVGRDNYYTLYFTTPFADMVDASLLYRKYNEKGVYLAESHHGIGATTRFHFTSAVLPMRDLFVTNAPQRFILLLKSDGGVDLLGVEMEFNPTSNPFGYRITRLISGLESLEFNASPMTPSVRIP